VPKVHPYKKLEYLLDETVHFPGEEVAAVAALTAEIAEEAAKAYGSRIRKCYPLSI